MSRIRALLSYAGLIERPRFIRAVDRPDIRQLRQSLQRGDWSPAADALKRTRDADERIRLVTAITEWPSRPEWLDAWVRQRRSAEALLARGAHGVQWAWQARGGGWGDTVGMDAFGLFFDRLGQAKADLEEAAELAPDDVVPWYWLLSCARGLELPDEETVRVFKEAVARSPRCIAIHGAMLQNLSSKWGGDDARMLAFARKAAARDPSGRFNHLVAQAHFEIFLTRCRAEEGESEYLRGSDVRRELLSLAEPVLRRDASPDDPDAVTALSDFALVLHIAGEHAMATLAFNRLAGRMGSGWTYLDKPKRLYRFARLASAMAGGGTAARVAQVAGKVADSYWKWKLRIGLGILVLVGAFLGAQRIGPRRALPAESPSGLLEQSWSARRDNARPHYARAADAMIAAPMAKWNDYAERSRDALPAELTAWVAENDAVIPHLRAAVQVAGCYLGDPIRSADGKDQHLTSRLRELVRFLVLRARVAAERHDLATFEECLTLIAGMARHLVQQPAMTPMLYGLAAAAQLEDIRLWPLTWSDLARDTGRAYIDRQRGLHVAIPELSDVLRHDLEQTGWDLIAHGSGWLALAVPPERTYFELQRAYEPAIALAAEPVEQQLDGDSEGRRAMSEACRRVSFWRSPLNLPRCLARNVVPDVTRLFELRGRTIAMQRGVAVVLAVLEARERTGRLPARLADLSPVPPADPFTGRPFTYRVVADDFLVYCWGADRDDDGGRHDERFGEKKPRRGAAAAEPDGDYVFWPLPWPEPAAAGGAN